MSGEPYGEQVAYVQHDDDGRITTIGSVSRVTFDAIPITLMQIVEGVGHPDTHWVDGGFIYLRPAPPSFDKTAIVADGVDAAVLEHDSPFSIWIDGELHEITEAPYRVELTADVPSTYQVRVEAFPTLPLQTEVVAS